jgi:peptidoglycan L-alanyl-D-glutamate endopeptidase CwlK
MRTLKAGMRGPDVTAWQKFLKSQDCDPGNIDGSFGNQTALATKAFQTREGLTADAAAGKDTLAKAGALGFRTLRRLTNSEVTPAVTAEAKRILREHHQDAFGTEIAFLADGRDYMARIEEHFHPPGGPLKPWGHHPGVSVFEVVGGAAVAAVHDADAAPQPDAPDFGGIANIGTPDTPGFQLSARSLERLKGVHADLLKLVARASELSPLEFTVLEGVRSLERQRQLVAQGRSQTLNSRHLTGHAVDIAPLERGQPVWDWPAYQRLAEFIKQAARDVNVHVEWGGDWTRFPDGPHWQLPVTEYPPK